MNIHWFEQNSEAVPSDRSWLSASEADRLGTMRFTKRRMDWLLGRWTAKNAVALFQGVSGDLSSLREIEIHASASGAPNVYFKNESAGIEISLSHRGSVGACVIAPRGALLGCDLEIDEPHCEAFTTDYFNADEQALISECDRATRSLVIALVWSAKESALKALKEGLRLDTRLVSVVFPEGVPKPISVCDTNIQDSCACKNLAHSHWNPIEVCCKLGQRLSGWWTATGPLIRTVLAAPTPGVPIILFKSQTTTAHAQFSERTTVDRIGKAHHQLANQSSADPNNSGGSW